MMFFGQKTKRFFDEELSKFFPNNIDIYVAPFAGTFSVACYLFESDKSPKKFIYNDIKDYNMTIYADKVHNLDYKEIFKMYDSENTFFYLDPPYYKKEFLYDLETSKDFHIELFNEINKLKGNFILSYNNDKFILNLYKDKKIYHCGDRFKNEIIITKNL